MPVGCQDQVQDRYRANFHLADDGAQVGGHAWPPPASGRTTLMSSYAPVAPQVMRRDDSARAQPEPHLRGAPRYVCSRAWRNWYTGPA